MKIHTRITKHKDFLIQAVSILLALLCVSLFVSGCLAKIKAELELQIRQSLADVTQQNVSAIQKELRSKQSLLLGVARGLPLEAEGIEDDILRLDEMKDLYQFKRVGYINAEGQAVTSDGYHTDMSQREFYKEGMAGKTTISKVFQDAVGDEPENINVITMPVFQKNGNTVRGVLFATYRTQLFHDLLSIDSFDGQGVSCILLPDGSVIVGSERIRLQETDNFFEVIASYGRQSEAEIQSLREAFAAGKSGFAAYETEARDYMYYMPVSFMDGEIQWYICTIAPAQVLDVRVAPINSDVQLLTLLILLSILICLGICLRTYRKQHERLLRLAYVDPLTGDRNYSAFRAELKEKGQSGYIVSVDLAEFKIINNSCGVETGDELLKRMWGVLNDMLHGGETGCHISGDHFVVFLRGGNVKDVISRVEACGERIGALSEELNIPHIVPKFGICATDGTLDPEDGYGRANLAKKSIENRRDHCYAVYDEELRLRRIREKWMEDEFEQAMAEHQFEIWYQPKYAPLTNEIVGSEALLRWRGSDGRMMNPGEFIPLFERNGMIARLDEYVFREVCHTQKAWVERGFAQLPVSVNLSRASLYYTDLVQRYLAIIRESGVDQSMVQLEITESAMNDNNKVEALIRSFREAGFQILMDDFGSGYSSLAALNMECFSAIKLDKTLIDCIGDEGGETLLYYVTCLAHDLGLSITAEGVEQQSQVAFLTKVKCDNIQGFYYSRPLPQGDYERKLAAEIQGTQEA